MKISLITTVYNEEKSILDFLSSYKNQTKYADEFIILDGGSSDNSVLIIQEFEKKYNLNISVIVDKTCSKKYVTGPIAKGRNIAIENARYDIIAVTDAGCILDKRWLEEIIKPFEDVMIDVVSGWYKAHITNKFQQKFTDILMPKLENINRDTFLPSSRSLAFRKICWKKVEGYPTLTYTAEDTKFDLALKANGYKFYFAEKAFVYWDVPFDIEEAKQKLFNYGYGDGQLKLRFKKSIMKILFILFPIHILLSKQKRKYFLLSYQLSISNSLGYIKGLLNQVNGTNK